MLAPFNNLSYRNIILSEAAAGGLPLGYWPLDEANGTAAVDQMAIARGSGTNGVIAGLTLNTTPLINRDPSRAPTFPGTNGAFVKCGSASTYAITTGTMEAWIKTSSPGGSFRGVMLKQFAWSLFLNDGVLVSFSWVGSAIRSTGVNLADGVSHHIAMSFQSGVSNGTIIYIDGSPALTTTITVQDQTIALTIGAGNDAGSIQQFAGQIGHCALYGYVLAADRIKHHYLAGLNGVYGKAA